MDLITKVSIIVPVYNVEDYLHDCLNSLINQTFKQIEIICIDDNSSDSSSDILEYFRKKDERIKIITNKENEGQGTSRNIGISQASGDYILFLDSDDWLDKNCISELYTQAITYDLDLVIFKLINYNQNTRKFFKTDYYSMEFMNNYFNKIFNYESLDKFKLFKLPNSPCNKFIRTNLLKENQLKFPQGLIFEDNLFFFKLMFLANKIMISNNYFYNRRIRYDSTINTNNQKLMDMITISDLVLDYFLESGFYQNYKKNVLNYVFRVLKNKFYSISMNYKQQYYTKMKKNIDKYINEYKLKDDFDNFLYKPNKAFMNLIISSETFDEFKNNVNDNKRSDFGNSILIPVQFLNKKNINKVFNQIKDNTIFEDSEIIFLVDNSIYKINSILYELNDLYSNVTLVSSDNSNLKDTVNMGINISKGNNIYYYNLSEFSFNTIKFDGELINSLWSK